MSGTLLGLRAERHVGDALLREVVGVRTRDQRVVASSPGLQSDLERVLWVRTGGHVVCRRVDDHRGCDHVGRQRDRDLCGLLIGSSGAPGFTHGERGPIGLDRLAQRYLHRREADRAGVAGAVSGDHRLVDCGLDGLLRCWRFGVGDRFVERGVVAVLRRGHTHEECDRCDDRSKGDGSCDHPDQLSDSKVHASSTACSAWILNVEIII